MTDEESTIEVFNVLNHELVPHHEVVPPEQAKAMMKAYKVSEDQLPKILSTDPAAKACGAKPGDIVKVTRNSPTAGRAIAYRFVAEFA